MGARIKPTSALRGLKPAFFNIEAYDRFKRLQLGLPVSKARSMIPWGYSEHPLDKSYLVPDVRAIRLLLVAKEYLKTCSLNEVARWLVTETNRHLSGEGLRLIINERCPFPEIMLDEDERERLYFSPTKFQAPEHKTEGETEEGRA